MFLTVIAFCMTMLLLSCTKQEKTVGGVVVGGSSGALIGGLAGGPVGAVVGGGLGGTAGGLIGNSLGDD